MKILVLGYYQRGNLGDDMFIEAFHHLLPEHELSFANPDDLSNLPVTDAVIVGAGDVFNEFFIPKINKLLDGFHGLVLAIGVGVSYESTIHTGYFDQFDHVWIRNSTHLRSLQKRIGCSKTHYIPDLGFTLPVPCKQATEYFTLGVFLANSLNIAHDLEGLTHSISEICTAAAEESFPFRVKLFAFNTSRTENDGDLNRQLYYLLRCNGILAETVTAKTTADTLREMATLDFAICGRFHAHVFCMMMGVSFVSISQAPKVTCLLKEAGLPDAIKDYATVSTAFMELDFVKHKESLKLYNRRARKELVGCAFRIRKQLFISKRSKPFAANILNKNISALQILKTEANYMPSANALIDPAYVDKIPQIARKLLAVLSDRRVVTSSPFLFGLENDLKIKPYLIKDMVDYINAEHSKMQDETRGRFNLDSMESSAFQGLHRSGWSFVTDYLKTLHHPSGVLLDVSVDSTFHWNEKELLDNGVLPRREKWVGFLHHTPLESCGNSCLEMFDKDSFIDSLRFCIGLYVLSDYLAKWVRNALDARGFYHVLVETLTHPTEFPTLTFSMERLESNSQKKLVQVGAWLRNSYAIYELQGVPYYLRKAVLQGPKMENHFKPEKVVFKKKDCKQISKLESKHLCRGKTRNKWVEGLEKHLLNDWCLPNDIFIDTQDCKCCPELDQDIRNTIRYVVEGNQNSVTHISKIENKQFDELLSENVVFLNLEDASAVNTIQECIARNTPIVVNRLPATIEALGIEYPLLYSHLSQVGDLLTMKNIRAAHEYLKAMPKENLRIENFIQAIRTSNIYAACR